MSASYDAFVKRLIAYRKANGLSQEELGGLANLTQSHYYKIESMSNIMSYNSLAALNEKGVNADFLVTGIKQKHTVLNDLFIQCSELDRADFLHMAVICIEIGLRHQGLASKSDREISTKEIEILRSDMEDKNTENHSVWKCIRRLNNLTQEQMSGKLGIDIKTYRDIEKGKSKPNVEILALVYDMLGYPPSLILDIDNKNYLYVINEVWLRLSDDLQNKIEKELKRILDFMSSIKEKNK